MAAATATKNPELVAKLAEIDRLQGLRRAAEDAAKKPTPIRFVDCRTFGHSWGDIETGLDPKVGWGIQLTCGRCTATRNDVVDGHGSLVHRHYRYPQGYRDPDRWNRNAWRMQFLRRLNGQTAT